MSQKGSLLAAHQLGPVLRNATVLPASLSRVPPTQLSLPAAPAPAVPSPVPAAAASASAMSAALSGQALMGMHAMMLAVAAAGAGQQQHRMDLAAAHRRFAVESAAAVVAAAPTETAAAAQSTVSQPSPSAAFPPLPTQLQPPLLLPEQPQLRTLLERTGTSGSGIRASVCGSDGGMAPRVSKLLAKWLRSDDEGPHVCPVCKQSFPTAVGLKQHQHDRWRCSLGSQPCTPLPLLVLLCLGQVMGQP
ncbi:hypothetical protein CLOP_g14260 [Closterium sp. NIES-67]|nr:hypothetical protein CLOP_g14260 [Closterium sp. NIES-67]